MVGIWEVTSWLGSKGVQNLEPMNKGGTEDPGLGRDPADPGGLPIGFDPQAFRGPAAVDQRHRFVASAVAELPWRLRLSGIVTLASGRPYTALSGFRFSMATAFLRPTGRVALPLTRRAA